MASGATQPPGSRIAVLFTALLNCASKPDAAGAVTANGRLLGGKSSCLRCGGGLNSRSVRGVGQSNWTLALPAGLRRCPFDPTELALDGVRIAFSASCDKHGGRATRLAGELARIGWFPIPNGFSRCDGLADRGAEGGMKPPGFPICGIAFFSVVPCSC